MTQPTGEMPVILEWVIELARKDILRTQTDFIGRMHQAMGDFEFACEHWADGEVDEASRDDAGEALAGLAGLALAQLALVSNPADPLSQFPYPRAASPAVGSARPISNRVTERQATGNHLWLVCVGWRDRFSNRPFLLENIFQTEAEAQADAARLATNPAGFSGYTDVTVRCFTALPQEGPAHG